MDTVQQLRAALQKMHDATDRIVNAGDDSDELWEARSDARAALDATRP